MSDVVISAKELGKRYRLGELDPYRNIGETLTHAVTSRLRRSPKPGTARREEYRWALAGASFDVGRGEVLGIVGRNGSGKSTLLKILSRVTRPTTGAARLRGRVGSLLEVGTGFHPELTGRENIYLNGIILGMKRQEISYKFDEIIEFAGVEEFLDTPVKRYSSGMHVRLAFAVAAHLQTEILIVDEVLAVGDAEFQRRCLAKIGDIVREGRTVLFVSHNLGAVRTICPRVLLLENGWITEDGPASQVIGTYLARSARDAVPAGWVNVSHLPRRGSGRARVTEVSYASDAERLGFSPFPEGPLEVSLGVESDAERTVGRVAVILYDVHGTKLVTADSLALGSSVRLNHGRTVVSFRIEQLHLNPGVYVLGWWLIDPVGNNVLDYVEHGVTLEVVDDALGHAGRSVDGLVPCEFAIAETVAE